MRKFLCRLVLFVLLLVGVDWLVGIGGRRLMRSAIAGDTKRNEYIANEMDAEVVLFGSSRCIHHYDSRLLADSLGMTVYNCGNNGMGIILFYARYRMLTERYVPKLVVYDVLTGFDLQQSDNLGYLTWLKPYYDHPGVDSIFWKIAPVERWKMCSNMYRYNGKVMQMIGDNLVQLREEMDGFRPLDGVMAYDPVLQDRYEPYEPDSIKLYYMERLIRECRERGTKLVFAFSPFYGGSVHTRETYAPLFRLAEQYGVPVLNHYSDSDIVHDRRYFADTYHMNREGASRYSQRLGGELKQIIHVSSMNPTIK